MGDMQRIVSAIRELTGNLEPINNRSTGTDTDTRLVIDLTLDDDESDLPVSRDSHADSLDDRTESQQAVGDSAADILVVGNDSGIAPDDDLTELASDESKMSQLELLECLTVDELKNLSRQLKIKLTHNVRLKSYCCAHSQRLPAFIPHRYCPFVFLNTTND